MLGAHDFFDLSATDYAGVFDGCTYVWQALDRIEAYIRSRLATDLKPNVGHRALPPGTVIEGGDVYIGEGTVIEPGVYIKGPALIGRNCEIRQGAYLRGNIIMADSSIVGHTSELKNTILLDGAGAPHFSYLGDSILGQRVNLGAGTKLSNLPLTSIKDPVTHRRSTIKIKVDGVVIDTGLAKMGAILGDDVQIGCNAVTAPGCLIGPRTLVYALASLGKGYYPADHIVKVRQQIEVVERQVS